MKEHPMTDTISFFDYIQNLRQLRQLAVDVEAKAREFDLEYFSIEETPGVFEICVMGRVNDDDFNAALDNYNRAIARTSLAEVGVRLPALGSTMPVILARKKRETHRFEKLTYRKTTGIQRLLRRLGCLLMCREPINEKLL